eukprot:TRINITY_DN720_c0_g1_i1.p1 TRINITY_DN720_c0_g1~~TRINITY_DN720_c0_g1_i1.p1  ORF type:complete len:338 (-),score=87.73 TRINITY_DN720_c0_g1_i1:261-1274(-)
MLSRFTNSIHSSVAQTLVRAYSSAAKQTLVVVEHDNKTLHPSTLSAVTAAKKLGLPVVALVAGHGCDAVVASASQIDGISKVLVANQSELQHPTAETLTSLLHACQTRHGFAYIVGPTSSNLKNTFPRLAAKLDVAPISDVVDVVSADTFVRPIYAGNALATVKSSDAVRIFTVRPTAFEKAKLGSSSVASAPAEDKATTSDKAQWISEESQKSDRPELTSARVVVSGGRGVGSADNFKIIEKLADKMGAAMGASRAAVDAGFVPNDMQIGQTGKIVAPELYVAVGISGAIQHLAGMKDSKVIVAINKDPDAPIFQVSDYGLVQDLFQAVPEMTSKV